MIDQALGERCNARNLPDGYWEAAAHAEAEATEKVMASGFLDTPKGIADRKPGTSVVKTTQELIVEAIHKTNE